MPVIWLQISTTVCPIAAYSALSRLGPHGISRHVCIASRAVGRKSHLPLGANDSRVWDRGGQGS